MFNILSLQKLPLSLRSKTIQVLPKILKPTLNFLPFAVQKQLLLTSLHSVFKSALEDGDFEFLQDKWLKISVTDINLNWLISAKQNEIIVAPQSNNINEDVSFSASGDDLLLIAGRKQDPDTLFFQRRLKIEGDTELGLEVKNLIDSIDIEELPSTAYQIVHSCATLLQQTQYDMEKV